MMRSKRQKIFIFRPEQNTKIQRQTDKQTNITKAKMIWNDSECGLQFHCNNSPLPFHSGKID